MARTIDTNLPGLEWMALEAQTEREAIAEREGARVAERRMAQSAARRNRAEARGIKYAPESDEALVSQLLRMEPLDIPTA